MAVSDPFLVRAVAGVRQFAMDTIDEVRWTDDQIVDLINTANDLVHGQILAATEPKVYARFDEATITVQDGVEDYEFPGNVRRFLRFVKKNTEGNIERELPLTDYLSDRAGIVLMDRWRGFRITPVPELDTDETWKLVYQGGVTPYLCYGTVASTTGTTTTLTAPSASQLGTLSAQTSFYVNSYLRIVSGTGAGQVRRVTAWTSALVATHKAWDTNPTGSSIYEWLPCLGQPKDVALMWRAAMMMKASDADGRHRESAQQEYRDLMGDILMEAADVQARTGPSLGDDYLDSIGMGVSY